MASTSTSLKLNQKVHALKDLHGVPRGTRGKVLLIGGVSWRRYWVDFENGSSLPGVDRAELGTKAEWEKQKDGPVATTIAATDDIAGPADEVPEGEAVAGVPFHLLQRSRAARERLGPRA